MDHRRGARSTRGRARRIGVTACYPPAVASTVFLHPKDARAVAQGHPWVYREAIAEKPSKLRPGQVVEVAAPGRPFLARGIYEPGSAIAVRVWTRNEDERIDEPMIVERLRAAAKLRETLRIPERTDAYRVANAEGDSLPGMVVDRFGDWLALTLQSEALREWAEPIVAALGHAVPARGVYLKMGEESALVAGERCPGEIEVSEPAVRMLVAPGAAGKPGLFPDLREARAAIAPVARGRTLLNLFAHTGAFSATAARAGAARVVSVDLSSRYLELARRNVELNAPGFAAHETVAGDVFETLRRFAKDERRFDVVVCDPPSFSTSKATGAFSVRDDYRPLVRGALRVLAPGGVVCFSTNFRGVTREQFLRTLHDGAEMEGVTLRLLTVIGQPADFPVPPIMPEAAYLNFAVCATA
jgi:23S rRNA (cytosine1962-C5)-methyltransferase